MAGFAPTANGSFPVLGGVRQRALICFLAASLALLEWNWLPSIDWHSAPAVVSSGVTINGVRTDLVCHGRGDSTVIIVNHSVVTRLLDDTVPAELARFVHLCTLTITEGAVSRGKPDLATVLPGLLIGAKAPAPYVIIAHASHTAVSQWVAGPSARQFVGFVLVDPPDQLMSLVVSASGDQRPLPLDDRNATVLAILSLFWPPDDA